MRGPFLGGDCMTFRQNEIMYRQVEILYSVAALCSLGLIPSLGFGFPLLCAISLVIIILVNPKLQNEFITIDETGIRCEKSGTQLWAYEWDRIAALKKSTRLQSPAVEVITYCKSGKPEPYSLPGQYFQLSRAAKKALKQYYKPQDHSRNPQKTE